MSNAPPVLPPSANPNPNPNPNPNVLQEAHARIAQLELALIAASIPTNDQERVDEEARQSRSERRVRFIELGAFVMMVVIVMVCVASVYAKPSTIEYGSPPMLDATPAPGALVVAPGALFSNTGPLLIDVNGDNKRDIIMNTWLPGHPEGAYWIVAIDRESFLVRWRSGPFTSEWRDARARAQIIKGTLYAIDGHGTVRSIDLTTGDTQLTSAVDNDPRDRPLKQDECPSDGSRPCVLRSPANTEKQLPASLKNKQVLVAYDLSPNNTADDNGVDGVNRENEERERFTLVHELTTDEEREHLVAWDSLSFAARKPSWNTRLVHKPHQEWPLSNTSPSAWHAIGGSKASGGGHRFYHLYQSIQGGYRMSAHELVAGALVYDVAIPSLDYGTFVESFVADADEVIFVANQSLFVIDGRTGNVTQRIVRF